ncbi:CaiB/BaiF CoA transferase family protein [Aspergillus lucknowensis]|uniref:CoA-transferase family III domain-containing protein n=1 Tax=Aspergillus lucknowensis TaxID=176173 RepID=A0ABR4LT55_9EURO
MQYATRQIALCALRGNSPLARGSRYYSTPAKPGPLHGVRILDLTRVLAGPFCTQILADYGADVVKVEHPNGGDDTRLWKEEGEDKLWKPGTKDTSLYFNGVNRNKRSISVNMKHERGKSIILELVTRADVVVDNFIPGKLEELGLGYDVFRNANPSIIHASISGYGATGPYAHRAGYDVIAAAEAGLLHITGEADGPPTKPGVGLMDMATGLYLHGAICAALVSRSRTGEGQKIDASLFETTISILNNVGMSWLNLGKEGRRWGTAHATIVPYEVFKTRDSELVLGAVNNRQFRVLCQRLGDEGLADDERFADNGSRVRNRSELKEILLRLFATKTTEEWIAVFEGSGMPHGPVNTIEKAFEHPQTVAREMVQNMEHSSARTGSIQVIGAPVKFSSNQPSLRSQPPGLGEHTDEVLAELGLSDDAISGLRNKGAI